jgi:pantetheine-phosphate adenylyltransferase
MKKAIYPGTFDPFTLGHQDILLRALQLFDEVVILLAVSPTKKPLIPTEDRRKLLEKIFSEKELKKKFNVTGKVTIDCYDGLVVDYAKNHKISHIVRGLRPTGDFELEFQMASMNKKLLPKVETLFFMTDNQYFFVSSSLVKEIFQHGGNIAPFVPSEVLKYLKNNIGKKK